jgi:2-haloalkanoic acid dehalogenase type II
MIKIISFDLDGTLVKSSYADKVWLEGVPQLYAKHHDIPLEQAKKYIYEEYQEIGESKKEWYDIEWWFNRFHLRDSWQQLLLKYKKYIEPFPEVMETIRTLKESYSLIIISNAKREFIDIQLEETQLRPYFARVFSSLSDFDQVKKGPEVYVEVCQQLQCQPHELLHVGDHREFDYRSPRTIGIEALYIDRKHQESGDRIIHSLSEIEEVLRHCLT